MNIKFLVMDVDGTLTDGKIYMGENGELFKAFNIKDGCGIKDILPKFDIVPVVLTARQSKMVEHRCTELGIENLYQGIRNKLEKLEEIISSFNKAKATAYELKNCAYIGDDILDLGCMQPIKEAGGVTGCPADAAEEVKRKANFVSEKNGGDGAVREFIEWIIGN